jgi:hypothetical protein
MAKPLVVRVPKPARSSYQPHRPFTKNGLLQNQVKHFRELEKNLPREQQTGIPHESVKTEADAAGYIRLMTERLHRPPVES